MKNLLRKEFLLSLNPNVILFALLGLTIGIPSYPGLVGFFYLLGGLSSIMPRALADKDIEYTAMLPVRKRDVVASKVLLIVLLELGTILITVPVAICRDLLWDPTIVAAGGSDPSIYAMEPSLATYGFGFLCFGLYNLLFFPWYYKNPQKINVPQIVSTLITLAVMTVFLALPIVLSTLGYPILNAANISETAGLVTQLCILGIGIVVFVVMTLIANKKAGRHFEKVDI